MQIWLCKLNMLTHSCMDLKLKSVVWTRHTLENNNGMKHEVAEYLERKFRLSSNEEFSFIYFLNISFVQEKSPKLSGVLRCYTKYDKDSLAVGQ